MQLNNVRFEEEESLLHEQNCLIFFVSDERRLALVCKYGFPREFLKLFLI